MNNLNTTPQESRPDFAAIKAKQQANWAYGDYGLIGTSVQITGESICEAMDVRAGASVLDVAGGNGNASLAAARRFCNVLCTDYVKELLDNAAVRAEAERLSIKFQVADAEDLPFASQSFDNVVSTFGVMFTPNQSRAASELLRVCKSGGKIGMANWTSDGFIGELFKLIGRYVAPPGKISSPTEWASEQFIDENFASSASHISMETRWFAFRYKSPQHWLDVFRTYYGPISKAFEATTPEKQELLKNDVLALIDSFNRADDGSMVVPSSYKEIVVTKKELSEAGS